MRFVWNLVLFLAVEEFWKSVKTWQSYRHEFGVLLFWDALYIALRYSDSVCISSSFICHVFRMNFSMRCPACKLRQTTSCPPVDVWGVWRIKWDYQSCSVLYTHTWDQFLTLYGHIKTAEQWTIIRWLVHWSLVGGLLHLVQPGGAWAGCSPAQSPHFTKSNSPPINSQCTNIILFDVAL